MKYIKKNKTKTPKQSKGYLSKDEIVKPANVYFVK
jgi:hypothetical protein